MSRPILITAASVAGATAAWWLGRAGIDVTVVERPRLPRWLGRSEART